MKVTIVRGGGLAGIVTRTEVDSNVLSPQDAHTLAQEVDRAGVRHLEEPASRQNRPDDLHYEILLDDGGDAVSRRFTDETMPAGVQRLVDWIDARPERSYAVEP
ncbi:MAG: protealysin inhibitor emfourin [Nocardioidaceae bacterium]